VVIFLRHFEQSFRQPTVVLLFFGVKILGNMAKVLVAIGDQEAFQL